MPRVALFSRVKAKEGNAEELIAVTGGFWIFNLWLR
jgi:hypothetical protein